MLDFLGSIASFPHDHSQSLHGFTGYSNSEASWHKTDDPWGAYLSSDGKNVDQGGTKWVDVSHGNWQDYNAHGVADAQHHGTTSLSFIDSVGVEGGQGNSSCIFGSCDDHDTFGISGHGHYGPGNGEDIGNLWNPATQHGMKPMQPSMELAAPPAIDSTNVGTAGAEMKQKTARPSLGHFYLCGPAMILGALNATAEVLKGEESRESWVESFKAHSGAAAGAVTPVGQFILDRHLFANKDEAGKA